MINREIDLPFDETYQPQPFNGHTFYVVRRKRRNDTYCSEACVVAAGHRLGVGAPLSLANMEAELRAVYGPRRRIPARARRCTHCNQELE